MKIQMLKVIVHAVLVGAIVPAAFNFALSGHSMMASLIFMFAATCLVGMMAITVYLQISK
jgi:hypothetical protein